MTASDVSNYKLAGIFSAMADMLAIQDAGYHRILAYRRAAENLASLGRPIEDVWQAGELDTIPGVGSTLAAKIDEYLRTGQVQANERLKDEVPPGVAAMLDITGVGPKRVALFWKALGVTSVAELAEAARAGRVASLPGMGAKSEAQLLAGIDMLARRSDRMLLGVALPLAEEMLATLRQVPGVVQAAPAGSLRRRRETVGDIDLLVATGGTDAAKSGDIPRVMDAFCSLPHVGRVLLRGETKSTVLTHGGLQADLRLLDVDRWGTALQYFTGSQAHNIRLRAIARQHGLSLSEYAFRRDDGSEILCPAEQEVYGVLGLPLVPPELREDHGEIEAACEGSLPHLLDPDDLRGDLHVHTTASDGHSSLLEMARAAQALGLSYTVIADHTWSLGIVRGLTAEQVMAQRADIDEVNRNLVGRFRLLAGVEVEIRADGSLDLPDEVLAQLDIVVASVHTGLRQPRDQVTSRMLAAIHNPHVDVVAHPTGRLIGEREPADLDLEAVFRAAAQTGTALEVNSHPKRLDLSAEHVRRAIQLGARLAVGSDAHHAKGLLDLRYGVATARRGWATRKDVVNSWPLEELLEWAARSGAS